MALASTKRTITIVLDADMDRLLDRAARVARTSRSEFIRAQLRRALETYRPHPAPRSAGAAKARLREPGTERNLFSKLER